MKKFFLHIAAMTVASVLSFLLCGTAASASAIDAEQVAAMEAVSAETYAFLRADDYSNAEILALSEMKKTANSYLAEYKVSGLTVGETYWVLLYVKFDTDNVQKYKAYESDALVSETSGYETISRQFTATKSTMTVATMAYYWKTADSADKNATITDYIDDATIMNVQPYTNLKIYTEYARVGDMNNDMVITQKDMDAVLSYLSGSLDMSLLESKRADIDMNGSIELEDAVMIQKYLEATDNRSIWGVI